MNLLERRKILRMRHSLLVALAISLFATLARAEAPTTLKQGDRIVFLGDSITAGGERPFGFITLIRNKLKEQKPDLGIEVFNAGISGNKVPDLQRRVDRDVIAKKPTIVFIYIGINDVWHGEHNPANGTPPDKFEAGLKEVIGKIQAAGAKVILCTPSVIGEKKNGANKLDAKLDQYADISRKVAAEMKLPLCDLRKAFVEYLQANNPEDKDKGILTADGVHLHPSGNELVAKTMEAMIGL